MPIVQLHLLTKAIFYISLSPLKYCRDQQSLYKSQLQFIFYKVSWFIENKGFGEAKKRGGSYIVLTIENKYYY